MASHPDIKTILWDSSHDLAATVAMMMTYSKRLTRKTDVPTYMKERGYVQTTSPSRKVTVWKKGDSILFVKPANDFKENNGPNNGFMRVFMQDVAMKLHLHNPEYGWDSGLVDALYVEGGALDLVSKPVDMNWRFENAEKTTPRHWIIPQLHFLGIYANDIANKAQNMAIVQGQPDFAVPVDLDAMWRGSPAAGSSFLKTLPPEIRISKMERNYAHIE